MLDELLGPCTIETRLLQLNVFANCQKILMDFVSKQPANTRKLLDNNENNGFHHLCTTIHLSQGTLNLY